MGNYLTIGQAAERLGLQVDTLRRLARKGAFPALTTAGGHRRFRPEDVEQYRNDRKAGRREAKAAAVFDEPTFEDEAPATATRRSRHHRLAAEVPRPSVPAPFTPTPPRPEPFIELAQSFLVRQQESAEEARLAAIRSNGAAAIPWGVPSHWRARVVAELERFVTAVEFPPRLSYANATEIVRARVKEFLAPWSREQDLEEAERAAERRCESLKSYGRTYAMLETTDWDWEPQAEARREVDAELKREVESDWSERDVKELVDEILDQWDDEEE